MAVSPFGTPTSTGSSATVTSYTLNTVGSVADGTLLTWHYTGQTTGTPPTPTGWLDWPGAAGSGTGQIVHVWYRFALSEPASYASGTLPGAARIAATMTAWTGVDQTTPVDVTTPAVTLGTTASTFTAITPVTAGSMIVAYTGENFASGNTPGTITSTNLTMDVQGASTAAAAVNVLSGVGHFAWTSGAFTPNMTQPTATTRTEGITIAIRAATAAAIPPILVMAPRAA